MASPKAKAKLIVEHRLWSANAQEEEQVRPPYSGNMQVTPLSTYAECVWRFPPHWLPAGSRNREKLLFLEPAFVGSSRMGLVVGVDDVLIDQFKQIMCYIIFAGQKMETRLAVATYHGRFVSLKKIFVAVKAAGFQSIGQLDASSFAKARSLLPAHFNESLMLAMKILIAACKDGFVIDGITDFAIEIESEKRIFDSSEVAGQEVLSDDQYGKIVEKACVLYDHYDEYRALILDLWNDRSSASMVRDWLAAHFPEVAKRRVDGIRQLAPRLLQTAGGIKLGFAWGPRPNELLSLRKRFFDDGHVSGQHVTFEVSKNKQDFPGYEREFPVDPVWQIDVVQEGLEFVHELYGGRGDRLFTGPFSEGEITAGHLGTNLKEFCQLAGFDFNVTSYSMRTTLISHTAQALTGGLTQAQLAMEHRSKRTTASYALSSPAVRDEIHKKCQEISEEVTKTLLRETMSMGGPGLQGEGGRRIEQSMATAVRSSQGVITKDEVAQEFLAETLRRNVYPLPVMPGVFCFKTLQARGECSKQSNDTLADVGRCSPGCPYGVQMEYRRDLVRHEISAIIPNLERSSELQKDYWLRQIADQLNAWPDLEPELREALQPYPKMLAELDKIGPKK